MRKVSSAIFLCFLCLAGIFLAVVCFWITEANHLIIFIATMNCLPLITMYFTVIDGPWYWYTRGEINQFVDTMVFIINRNNKEELYETGGTKNTTVASLTNELGLEEFDLNEKNVRLTFTSHTSEASTLFTKDEPIDENPKASNPQSQKATHGKNGFALLFTKKYCLMVVGASAMSTIQCQLYTASALGVANIGLSNINVNLILMSSMEMFIYILCVFIMDKLPRIKGFNYCMVS